jgi:hypothetical protein
VHNVQDAIDQGKLLKKPENIPAEQLANHNTLDAIENHLMRCIGGARRDEEKPEPKNVYFFGA